MRRLLFPLAALALGGGLGCGPEAKAPPVQPTIERFVAHPEQVDPGTPVTLSWRTTGATHVQIATTSGEAVELGGANPAAGSVEVHPPKSTTYTLVAESEGGKATATVGVQVRSELGIVRFEVDRGTVSAGESARLLWSVEGASHLRIEAEGEALFSTSEELSGSLAVTPERQTTYTLTATLGDAERRAEAEVRVRPVIEAFAAEVDGIVAIGAEVPLRWEVRGAERLTLSNALETLEVPAPAGETTFPITERGTFRLTATNGSLIAQRELRLQVRLEPYIGSFEVPENVTVTDDGPGVATLMWKVFEADRVRIVATSGQSWELEEPFGTLEVEIHETTTFTLQAENGAGTVEVTKTATAVPPATIHSFEADKLAVTPGSPLTLTWEVEDASSVRLIRNDEALELLPGATGHVDTPTESATYTLIAKGQGGDVVQAELDVTVTTTFLWATLRTSPPAVLAGEPALLRWTVNTVVPDVPVELTLVDPQGVPVELGGHDPRDGWVTVTVDALGAHTFTLTASALGQISTAEADVIVGEAPTLTLGTDPPRLDPTLAEWEVLLVWQTEGADTLEFYTVDANEGEQFFYRVPRSFIEAGSYPLTVDRRGPLAIRAIARTAHGLERKETYPLIFGDPVIHSFTASQTSVAAGATVTFSWETGNGLVEFEDLRSPPEEVSAPLFSSFRDPLVHQSWALPMTDCGGACGTFSWPDFSFPFFGTAHETFTAFADGFLHLGTPAAIPSSGTHNPEQRCLPQTSSTWDIVDLAPFWSTLQIPGAPTGLLFGYAGEDPVGRKFIAPSWAQAQIGGDFFKRADFQLVLWDDGTVEYRYGQFNDGGADGADGTIGFQSPDRTESWNLLCGGDGIDGGLSNRSWRLFGPPPATGSADIVVDESGDYTLCVRGYEGVRICETLAITVSGG